MFPHVCFDTSCDSGTSTLQTLYSNFIASQLYELKCMKSQHWLPSRCVFLLVMLVSFNCFTFSYVG